MNIQSSKKLRRDICRSVGHEWKIYSRYFGGMSEGGNICSRCKRKQNVWRMGKPTYVGTMPPRVDVPVGQVVFDACSEMMIVSDGTSWRTIS